MNNEVINAINTYNLVRDRIVEAINKLYDKLYEEANSADYNIMKYINKDSYDYYGPKDEDVQPIDDTDSLVLLDGSDPLSQTLHLWEVEGKIWVVWGPELMHRLEDSYWRSYWRSKGWEPNKFLFDLKDLDDIDAFVQREFDKRFPHWKEDGKLVSYEELTTNLRCIANANKTPIKEDWEMTEYRIGGKGPAGGWIFYDKGSYSDGWRYLEAAPADIKVGTATSFVFGYYRASADGTSCYVNGTTTYEEGTLDSDDGRCTGTAIGTGKANTTKLVSKMESSAYSSSSGTDTTANYAAKLCDDCTYGGYSDWFLPSKDELNLMYTNLKAYGLGGFSSDYYWSSSEDSNSDVYRGAIYAWFQYFYSGYQSNLYRYNNLRVRAVRAF